MLDFVISDWETHLLVLMEWGSCLRHLPRSSCFKFHCLLFLEESCLVLTSLGVFIAHGGGVHTVKWWITGAESWLQAWFTAGQRLNHSTQPGVGLQHFSCLDNACWYILLSERKKNGKKKAQHASYTHSFLIWSGLYYVFAVIVCVRWESLQVSTLQRLHRSADGLPRLPSGSLPLPPLAKQQGSFFSTAAHQQQQQLQPQPQAQTSIQGRLEPSCRSLPRPGEPRRKRPAHQQAARPRWQRRRCGRLLICSNQEVPVWAFRFVCQAGVCHVSFSRVSCCTGADVCRF